MRVLHLNNPAQVASNLVSAQRSLGIDASLVLTSTRDWHSNFDYDLSKIDTKNIKGKLEIGKKLYALISECDILHYHGQAVSAGYRDLFMWSGLMDKPVVLHHHGTEVRNKKYPKFANKFVNYRYVSTPDLLAFVPDAEWLPNPVNMDDLLYSQTEISSPLKILHAPTNRQVKNTETVLEAIAQVEKKGLDIQFTLLEDVKHSELITHISDNDLIIDWMNPKFGIYGVFSIESMALGKTVICSLTDSLYKDYELPIINVHPSDLASKITEICENPSILMAKGKIGYDFVQKNHNYLKTAKHVIERYKLLLR